MGRPGYKNTGLSLKMTYVLWELPSGELLDPGDGNSFEAGRKEACHVLFGKLVQSGNAGAESHEPHPWDPHAMALWQGGLEFPA